MEAITHERIFKTALYESLRAYRGTEIKQDEL